MRLRSVAVSANNREAFRLSRMSVVLTRRASVLGLGRTLIGGGGKIPWQVMTTIAQAQGTRAKRARAYDATDSTPPAAGFTRIPFVGTMLDPE